MNLSDVLAAQDEIVSASVAAALAVPGEHAREPERARRSPASRAKPAPLPSVISSAKMVEDFVPPDYQIDGIVQRRFLYSVTAPTGAGKTALLTMLAAISALGRPFGPHGVEQCKVLYFAGENPDDVTMRWIAMAEHMEFDAKTIEVHFIRGTFSIPEMFNAIRVQIAKMDGVGLVIIDTSAAYFQGTDENGNVELGNHARDLRGLTTLPGEPAVLVACHPTKSADPANLLPRGGGAFLAEVDGNLVCIRNGDGTVKLWWHGKFRGPDFKPVPFELQTVTTEQLRDSKGRQIPTVLARVISDDEERERYVSARRDEDEAIVSLQNGPKSFSGLAKDLDWISDSGAVNKSKGQRVMEKLKEAGLASLERTGWVLTKKGQEAASQIKTERFRRDTDSKIANDFAARMRENTASEA